MTPDPRLPVHPLDPDPLSVSDDPWADGYFEGWEVGFRAARNRRPAIVAVVAAAISGAVVATTLLLAGHVLAAPRSGLQSGDSFSAGRSEAPQPSLLRDAGVSQVAGNTGRPETGTRDASGGVSPVPPLAAPEPTDLDDGGGISSALVAGTASWYDVGPGMYGAVPSYRWGDPRYKVRVCRLDKPSRCVTVTILDFCGCPGSRVIDLSRQAFARLESPSRGLVAVTVESGGGGPDATLPATDLP